MKPKAIEKELNRQAVLFEEKARQDYEAQLLCEADQQDRENNEIEYAKKHTTFFGICFAEYIILQFKNR